MNEIDEDKKNEIAEMYERLNREATIKKAADECGVSEATFHKYKHHKKPIKKINENEEENDDTKNFEDDIKPDNEEDDDEEIIIDELHVI